MKQKRKNGFMLLLVVSFIPLIGVMATVLTNNSRNLLVQTRLEELDMRARNAFESGKAWAMAQNKAGLAGNEEFILQLDDHSSCSVRIVSQSNEGIVVRLTAKAQDRRFSKEYQKEIVLTP